MILRKGARLHYYPTTIPILTLLPEKQTRQQQKIHSTTMALAVPENSLTLGGQWVLTGPLRIPTVAWKHKLALSFTGLHRLLVPLPT